MEWDAFTSTESPGKSRSGRAFCSSSRLSGFENPADNWTWRLRRGSLTNRLAQRIARMNRLFDRGGRQ